MSHRHIVHVRFQPKDTQHTAFAAAMQDVKHTLPQAAGCKGVQIFTGETPAEYILVEDWDNEKAHAAHVEGLVASGAWAKLEALLKTAPELKILRPL